MRSMGCDLWALDRFQVGGVNAELMKCRLGWVVSNQQKTVNHHSNAPAAEAQAGSTLARTGCCW